MLKRVLATRSKAISGQLKAQAPTQRGQPQYIKWPVVRRSLCCKTAAARIPPAASTPAAVSLLHQGMRRCNIGPYSVVPVLLRVCTDTARYGMVWYWHSTGLACPHDNLQRKVTQTTCFTIKGTDSACVLQQSGNNPLIKQLTTPNPKHCQVLILLTQSFHPSRTATYGPVCAGTSGVS